MERHHQYPWDPCAENPPAPPTAPDRASNVGRRRHGTLTASSGTDFRLTDNTFRRDDQVCRHGRTRVWPSIRATARRSSPFGTSTGRPPTGPKRRNERLSEDAVLSDVQKAIHNNNTPKENKVTGIPTAACRPKVMSMPKPRACSTTMRLAMLPRRKRFPAKVLDTARTYH
jgi:hypothetical protein